ncbi:AGAP000461-PA-like protein [Anopheles sinensis]|uniref:AGAP000461-PA-like protein n=1 Tax=Anopheles sinensis TaxID=74873 RepID=A0A084W167_ANOSI|nr:AGAP000461-PA-like protein [Anopheles sinensis]
MEDTLSPVAVCQEHDHEMLSSHLTRSEITLLYKSSQAKKLWNWNSTLVFHHMLGIFN